MANLDSGEPIVITGDGVPRSTRVSTSDATPIEEVREVVFARARKAVREIRARAAKTGGKVSEESIASKQNAALGPGQREGKAVGLRECRVTTLVGQSEDLASGIEFDDLEAKGRKVGLKLGTQFECVHLIGDNELPGETEERLKQAPPFEIQQDGGVGDDDDHGPVVL